MLDIKKFIMKNKNIKYLFFKYIHETIFNKIHKIKIANSRILFLILSLKL